MANSMPSLAALKSMASVFDETRAVRLRDFEFGNEQ